MAGLLALLLVVVFDAAVPSVVPWRDLLERIPKSWMVDRGVARDQALLGELDAVPEGTARVFLVGSSRLRAAFSPKLLEDPPETDVPYHLVQLSHGGVDPFAIRSLSDELKQYEPSLVVILVSEFETHLPPRPHVVVTFGSLSAVAQLAREIGLRQSLRERQALERLLLAAVFDTYRYRTLLLRAGGNALRTFDMGRDRALFESPVQRRFLLPPGEPTGLDPVRRLELDAGLEALYRNQNLWAVRETVKALRQLTRGRHAEVQMGLLTEAVNRFRDAGARVLLVEGPLSPVALEYYDPAVRKDFRAFAGRLAADPGVQFLSVAEIGVFAEDDFVDLSHTGPSGSRRMTRAILERIHRILEEAS